MVIGERHKAAGRLTTRSSHRLEAASQRQQNPDDRLQTVEDTMNTRDLLIRRLLAVRSDRLAFERAQLELTAFEQAELCRETLRVAFGTRFEGALE